MGPRLEWVDVGIVSPTPVAPALPEGDPLLARQKRTAADSRELSAAVHPSALRSDQARVMRPAGSRPQPVLRRRCPPWVRCSAALPTRCWHSPRPPAALLPSRSDTG